MDDDDQILRVKSALLIFGQLGTLLHDRLAMVLPEGLTSNSVVATILELELQGAQRPSQIQVSTRLSSGGVTRMLDRLEAAGLTTRQYGAIGDDRRGTLVKLTPKGRRTCRRMAESVAAVLGDVQVMLKELDALGQATNHPQP